MSIVATLRNAVLEIEAFEVEASKLSERETAVTLRESAVLTREMNADARSAELDQREHVVSNRERNLGNLRQDLALEKAKLKTAQEDAVKAAEKLEALRKEFMEAKSELGRINSAFPGLLDRLPKQEAVATA